MACGLSGASLHFPTSQHPQHLSRQDNTLQVLQPQLLHGTLYIVYQLSHILDLPFQGVMDYNTNHDHE